jgi:hypothetical protein
MTDGDLAPTLVSPVSLKVEPINDCDPGPLWAERPPKPPFTKDEMLVELKRAILVQANQIAHAGKVIFALTFIGFESVNPVYPYCGDDPQQIDLSRFAATAYFDRAYDYAFQVGRYWEFGDDSAQDVMGFIHGANPQASNGDCSPLADAEGLCRRAADTAFGRWKLEHGSVLTIRELALLGQMREAAVRNSLGKERIANENGVVMNGIALSWLRQRWDFKSVDIGQDHRESWVANSRALLTHWDFQKAFAKIMKRFPITAAELARKAFVEPDFVDALARGEPIVDRRLLHRVGAALELDEPHFISVAEQASVQSAAKRGVGACVDIG